MAGCINIDPAYTIIISKQYFVLLSRLFFESHTGQLTYTSLCI